MQVGIDSFAAAFDENSRALNPADRLRQLVEQIEHADEVGLDAFGIGEHHRREFLDSAPAVILGAAGRTQRIRLTSAVTVLSAEDPVRAFQITDARRPRDQQMMMVADPAARAETQHDVARESARRTEIDIFERGRVAQLRVAEPLREFPRFPRRPFGVDEQAESVLETELGVLARAPLLLKRRGHRRQVECVEFVDRRMGQHTCPRSRSPPAGSRA